MDIFIALGKSGYANSFRPSVESIVEDRDYDVNAGIRFEYPPLNRNARAAHRRAVLDRTKTKRSLDNLKKLAELDVRTAYIEINRAKEQVAATAATRILQEDTLRAETEKFKVGKSTSLLVAQVQRDLVESQIAEVEAVVKYLKSLIELYRLEGSLLKRRGIVAPGDQFLNVETE